jgi:hypothetical protein
MTGVSGLQTAYLFLQSSRVTADAEVYGWMQVPIPLYFMTHAYFCFYHALSNIVIRRTRTATHKYGSIVQNITTGLVIFLLAYATAYMETLTIAHFPYYKFKVSLVPGLHSRQYLHIIHQVL